MRRMWAAWRAGLREKARNFGCWRGYAHMGRRYGDAVAEKADRDEMESGAAATAPGIERMEAAMPRGLGTGPRKPRRSELVRALPADIYV